MTRPEEPKDLEYALRRAQDTINDIKTICRNHDVYDSKTLARVIEQRIDTGNIRA